MITETMFYGDAKRDTTTATFQLYRHEARLRAFGCTSAGHAVILPEASAFLTTELGADWAVYNENTSTQNFAVKATIAGVLTTLVAALAPGQIAICHLLVRTAGAEKWTVRVQTRNTARTGSASSHVSPTLVIPKTYEPSCFEGDPCDFAQREGNVPLDGESGRPLVIAPMIQDVIAYAQNENREPIRGADLVMPSVPILKFKRDNFLPDSNHPLAATVLSQEFYDELINNERWHAIPYSGPANGISRHWHHVRWSGGGAGGWGLDVAFSCRRHVWKKQITYYPNGGTTPRTLEIRFVMEHTVFPEPLLEPLGGGGQQDYFNGAWGAVFHVYVFTDELSPTFVDGNTFTPAGWAGAIPFTKDDPCAWSGIVGMPGATLAKRGVHPQCVIAAHIPTSFESPAEYTYIPPEDRASFNGFSAHNRYCFYKASNAAPWLPGGCTEAAYLGAFKYGTIVFGYADTSFNYGPYTPGGSFPRSKPLEFITIENGRGVGETYLKPTAPGWDEVCGRLDLLGGSSISIKLCTDDKYGIDGVWPKYAFNSCSGHPDEPFEGFGGSHTCFNNGNPDLRCCVLLSDVFSFANEHCILTQTHWGDISGFGGCEVPQPPDWAQRCFSAGVFSTGLGNSVADYTYMMHANQDLRSLDWKSFKRDPLSVAYDFTYAGASDPKLTTKRGTFTTGATIDVTAAGGSGPVRSILFYEPAAQFRRAIASVRAKKLDLQAHSLLFRSAYAGAQLTSYELRVTPTGGSNATVTVRKIIADVETVLFTKNITNAIATMTLRASWWGCDLQVWWDYARDTAATTKLVETSIDGTGFCGIGSSANSTQVQFDQFIIDDKTVEWVESSVTLNKETITVQIHSRATTSYGHTCSGTSDPACGTPPRCNCTTSSKTLFSTLSTTSGAPDVTYPNCFTDPVTGLGGGTDGSNPGPIDGALPGCACYGRYIAPDTPACAPCPPSRVEVGVSIPKRCANPLDGIPESVMCKGIQLWAYAPAVAP